MCAVTVNSPGREIEAQEGEGISVGLPSLEGGRAGICLMTRELLLCLNSVSPERSLALMIDNVSCFIHCNVVPLTEGPGGLQSVGSQRVRHNLSHLACIL